MFEQLTRVSLKGRWDPHSVTETQKPNFTFPRLRKSCEPGPAGRRKNSLWWWQGWEQQPIWAPVVVVPATGGPIRLFLGCHPCYCGSLLASLFIFHLWFSRSFIKSFFSLHPVNDAKPMMVSEQLSDTSQIIFKITDHPPEPGLADEWVKAGRLMRGQLFEEVRMEMREEEIFRR